MRNRTCALFSLLLFLCFGRNAFGQTAYAPGGLFVHPTAYTDPRGTLSLYAAAFDQYEDQGKQNNYIPVSLTYSPTDRLEISGIAAYHDGWFHPRHIHLGSFVKYQLIPDASTHPAFAITGAYVGHDDLEWTAAGVISHAFRRNGKSFLIAHTGVKWGQSGEGGHSSDFGGFVGLEVPLSQEFRLVGEESTRFRFDRGAASSIGVMWQPRKGPGITVGFVNSGRSQRLGFFFGVGIGIGGLK